MSYGQRLSMASMYTAATTMTNVTSPNRDSLVSINSMMSGQIENTTTKIR